MQGNAGNWGLPRAPTPDPAQSSSAEQDMEGFGYCGLLFELEISHCAATMRRFYFQRKCGLAFCCLFPILAKAGSNSNLSACEESAVSKSNANALLVKVVACFGGNG